MDTEVEAKFLNVDHDELRAKLEAAGATRERPIQTVRRVMMDFPDNRLEETRKGRLRISDEGYTVKLTYKQPDNWAPSGVRMAEVVVAGLDAAKNLLETIGMEAKAYQETKRETWRMGESRVILNQWPFVRPFCELEGEDEAELKRLAAALELRWDDAVFGSIEPVYLAEYDITEDEFHRINDLTFVGPRPQILESRRRDRQKAAS